jgi:tetratricopeptide (TPR) repeat protein
MHVSLALTWLLLASDRDAQLREAQRLEQQSEEGMALAQLDALTRDNLLWALPRLEAARLRLKSGVELERAELDLEVARSLAPENPRAHYLFGLLSAERRRLAQARTAYEMALALRPDFGDAQLGLARVLAEEERFAASADVYRLYLTKHPAATAARLQFASALERSGREREAEEQLTALARAAETRRLGTQRLADFLERRGRGLEAANLRSAESSPGRRLRPLRPSGR